jgi:hypothetical protein
MQVTMIYNTQLTFHGGVLFFNHKLGLILGILQCTFPGAYRKQIAQRKPWPWPILVWQQLQHWLVRPVLHLASSCWRAQ